ncbi:MAG TPA: methyltransferase domain-containing protein [Phycisphaerae bacterium]|nr:methyltransferase domain-containing protein [Phycisphaerae bacterium]
MPGTPQLGAGVVLTSARGQNSADARRNDRGGWLRSNTVEFGMSTNAAERAVEHEYVLGTNEAELERLGLQHRLWGAQAYALWERAGFRPGCAILDIGCGPGFATFDLAALVGGAGRVIAVDSSQRFLDHVRAQCAARGVRNVELLAADVGRLALPAESLDGAYARWVLCFVPDPAAVVRAVAQALRPGAALAVQDYFDYASLTLAPRSPVFARIVDAVNRSWRAHGGDPDVVGRLPRLLAECGLELRELRPHLRVARPHDPLWQWPATFFRNFVPAMVREGFLTAQDQADFENDWAERSRDPNSFFVAPPVYDVLAVKPG